MDDNWDEGVPDEFFSSIPDPSMPTTEEAKIDSNTTSDNDPLACFVGTACATPEPNQTVPSTEDSNKG